MALVGKVERQVRVEAAGGEQGVAGCKLLQGNQLQGNIGLEQLHRRGNIFAVNPFQEMFWSYVQAFLLVN